MANQFVPNICGGGLKLSLQRKKGEKIEMLSNVIEWIYKVTLVGCVPFHSTRALCLGLKPGGFLLHE